MSDFDKLFGRVRQDRPREYSKRLSQHAAGAQTHASMGFVLKIRGIANAEKALADGNLSKLIHCGKGNDQILFV
ncbi:hypothetical protein [Paraburkholderia sp.]|uniref:hypothetical protein n=1 Tax=Paraburkholderia sp. TaxID=1926495 RepID=UPI002AFE220D|nr:hypothetical protein [Paraburkholderia sp.]